MAFIRGRDGQVKFAGTAIANLKSWSLSDTANTTDVSTMAAGVTNAPYIPTLFATTRTVSGSVSCYFDADDTVQLSALNNLAAGTTLAIVIYPETGESYTISSALITSANFNASVDGLVELSVNFTASGGSVTSFV